MSLKLATKPLPAGVAFALFHQLVVICLSATILDGGMLGLVCLSAFVIFWGGTGILIARRHGVLTPLDTLLIRWGYLPICIVMFCLAQLFWR
jgi:hypothetical protein